MPRPARPWGSRLAYTLAALLALFGGAAAVFRIGPPLEVALLLAIGGIMLAYYLAAVVSPAKPGTLRRISRTCSVLSWSGPMAVLGLVLFVAEAEMGGMRVAGAVGASLLLAGVTGMVVLGLLFTYWFIQTRGRPGNHGAGFPFFPGLVTIRYQRKPRR